VTGDTRHSSTPVSNLALFHSFSAELTDRQRSALAELAAGRPVTTAASAAGVHRSTLHNWLGHDPNFQAAYSALARHQAESASDLDTVARAALQALIAAPATPSELRLRAIQTALRTVHSAPASAPALAPRPMPQRNPTPAHPQTPLPPPSGSKVLPDIAGPDVPASLAPRPSAAFDPHRPPVPGSIPASTPHPIPPAPAPSSTAQLGSDATLAEQARVVGQASAREPASAGRPALVGRPFQAASRLSGRLHPASPDPLSTPAPTPPRQIARNAPCPCGSKLKYKRCCGKDAKPVLHAAA